MVENVAAEARAADAGGLGASDGDGADANPEEHKEEAVT